ncbi:MAG: hypothetical protein GY756_07645 [bacterium]|nr:hypothetical protein [bacterium]
MKISKICLVGLLLSTFSFLLVFDLSSSVNGWILLDANPDNVKNTIAASAKYEANHIQLSQDIIMNIDDITGDDTESKTKVELINTATDQAHKNNMKVYIWCHEFSNVEEGTVVDFSDPTAQIWTDRKAAYKKGLAKIPKIDGIILMFGSAPTSIWDEIKSSSSQKQRLCKTVEYIGGYIVNDLKKELFIRTFLHEPDEITWFQEGLPLVEGVEFTGMHKGPVQDWEPYNPQNPCIGHIGNHPCIMELDIAGEYYGRSVLPFCSPGYYRYRLNNLWGDNKGIGAALRVERGDNSALNKPNEVNLYAIDALLKNHNQDLDTVWNSFIKDFYGLNPSDDGQTTIKQILKNTFPIRRKSNYTFGIWVFCKNSELPTTTDLSDGQFFDRGYMPKWDKAWTNTWNSLDKPDKNTVIRAWQEGTEAVVLANNAVLNIVKLKNVLSKEKYDATYKWIMHQKYTTEAWRDIDLITWGLRSLQSAPDDKELQGWIAWAYNDLVQIKANMITAGLAEITIETPGEIQSFVDNTSTIIPKVTPRMPDTFLFSPVVISNVTENSAEIKFNTNYDADVTINYGLNLPIYSENIELGTIKANDVKTVKLTDLKPNERHVIRVQAKYKENTYYGGDFWIFTIAE